MNVRKSWALWIILIVTLVYAPFLGFRVIRMAGDEKVYVSQALEMAAQGNWFLQRLQDVPDYYKGPLHYLLLRLGLIFFGKNAWAALYMNFFFLIGGAISVASIVRKYCPKWAGGPIWAGAFFATCVGVYTHSFASQMEAELACLFAMALYLLDRTEPDSPGLLFWILTGLIGWSKSPLHSVLAGSAAVLYWLASGQLLQRMRSWRSWLAVVFGIIVCGAGYLPAYVMDKENFINIYIMRETFAKGDSGQHWSVSLLSVLGFYLLPWLLLCLVAYAEALWNLVSNQFRIYTPEVRRVLLLSVCWVTPSFIFFWYHPYHFENYNLPVISGVILFISLIIGNRSIRWNLLYRVATFLTAALVLALPILLTAIDGRFVPAPPWWPRWLAPISCIFCGASAIGLIYYGLFDRMRKMHALAFAMVGFYLSLGATITVIGERELVDLRSYLDKADSSGEHIRRLGYYNLHQNIWSEWGFLNLWTDREFHEIHKPDELKQALLAGEAIVVPARGPLDDFKTFVQKELPGQNLEMTPWKRWRTQGRSDSGESLWQSAWDKRDLKVLEVDYFIVRKRKSGT